MKKLCTIYRSVKKEGMFLYVDKEEDLTRVPDALLKKFGKPEFSMFIVLHPERKLARADISKVLAELDGQGYYLQMPPQQASYMKALHEKNSKIGH